MGSILMPFVQCTKRGRWGFYDHSDSRNTCRQFNWGTGCLDDWSYCLLEGLWDGSGTWYFSVALGNGFSSILPADAIQSAWLEQTSSGVIFRDIRAIVREHFLFLNVFMFQEVETRLRIRASPRAFINLTLQIIIWRVICIKIAFYIFFTLQQFC